jgi:hypothetical protein
MSCFAIRQVLSLKSAVLAVAVVAGLAAIQPLAAQDIDVEPDATPVINTRSFVLHPNPKFTSCLGVAGQPTPIAKVTVTRGKANDTLTISGHHFKPGLAFDMFTVQRSNLLSDASVDPAFTNFGMAWYQSDLEASSNGEFKTTIQTILLDQIFGFDPDQSNPSPINTFHVGFWFNNPNDANVDGCVFDVTKPTPFNGEHNAGPVAFISVPDAHNNLGPLCTNPNTSTTPASCNP